MQKRNDLIVERKTQKWQKLYEAGKLKRIKKELKRAVWIFQYVGKDLQNDLEIASVAINQDARLFKYAGEDVRNDPKIASVAISRDWKNIFYIGDEIIEQLSDEAETEVSMFINNVIIKINNMELEKFSIDELEKFYKLQKILMTSNCNKIQNRDEKTFIKEAENSYMR